MNKKYVKNGEFLSATALGNASWGWHNIVKGRNVIKRGASWRIGDGKLLIFWTNWWVGNQLLGLNLEINIPDEVSQAKVSNFILNNKCWNIAKLHEILPEEKIEMVRAIPIAHEEGVIDKI